MGLEGTDCLFKRGKPLSDEPKGHREKPDRIGKAKRNFKTSLSTSQGIIKGLRKTIEGEP